MKKVEDSRPDLPLPPASRTNITAPFGAVGSCVGCLASLYLMVTFAAKISG